MLKVNKFLAIIALFLFVVSCGSGGGGSSGGGNGDTIGDLKISVPTSNPPVVLAGEQTDVTISTYVAGSYVELQKPDGEDFIKIGEMKDDGENGDQTAGDNVYTIQITVDESEATNVTYRIKASSDGEEKIRDIIIPVIHIPSLTTNAELNQMANDLFLKAVETQTIATDFFNDITNTPLETEKQIADNLLDIFSQFEAVTKQDAGFEIYGMAKDALSIVQLRKIFGENPLDPRVREIKQGVIEGLGFTEQELKALPSWELEFYAREYSFNRFGNNPNGSGIQSLKRMQKFTIKQLLMEPISLVGKGLSELYDLGVLGTIAVKEAFGKGVGIIVDWFSDDSGEPSILIGQVEDSEEFTVPTGTHNILYSFGDDIQKAVVKDIPVLSQQITTVEFSPGTVTSFILGSISGSVKDAVTQSPLQGVSIDVYSQNSIISTGTTDSNGAYSLSVPSGSGYRVEFSKTGYITAIYYDVSVETDTTTYLEPVLQIDTTYAGTGDVGGRILNALDGTGVSGLTINLREGINVTSGSIIATTTTESNGSYSFTGLNAGYYTAEVSGSVYNTTYFTIICIGGQTKDNQNATITPILSSGETRIILTWEETPWDLDSHLTGPTPSGSRFHIYFGDKTYVYSGTTYADLDLDDTTSYGPETITIYQQISGVYRYSVHDYSNKSSTSSYALSNSGAQVRVYRGSNLVATFNVPSNQGGTLWTVFEMDGDTITPINTMLYESSPSAIQSVSLTRSITTDVELIRNIPPKR